MSYSTTGYGRQRGERQEASVMTKVDGGKMPFVRTGQILGGIINQRGRR